MTEFYSVEVPGKPAFPESCVICAGPRSEPVVNMTVTDEASRVDFYLYKLPFRTAQGPRLEIPVHDSCAKGIRNRFLGQVAAALLASAVVVAAAAYTNHLGFGLIGVFAVFALFFIFVASKRAPFEFQGNETRYFLMFDDPTYAEQVAALNGTTARRATDRSTGR